MKKILFLFLFIFVKINAYEYKIATGHLNSSYYIYYYDSNGEFRIKRYIGTSETDIIAGTNNDIYTQLGYIKFPSTDNGKTFDYISSNDFNNILKNDINFLNIFYTQNSNTRNSLFNYFYNNSYFRNTNYVVYENYEILYNNKGLAVESVVNGVWAGLYDKDNSGYLFDVNGNVYLNGVKQIGIKYYISLLHLKINEAFSLINWNKLKLIPIIILVFSVFYLLIRKFKGTINGFVKYFN